MTIVLLTGGSGFIAAHILEILLAKGYTVYTTVRSEEKAANIRKAHPNTPAEQLNFRIVPDIAIPGAFDEAVKIEGLEAVIHTASPFHFNIKNTKKDLLDPAIIGKLIVTAKLSIGNALPPRLKVQAFGLARNMRLTDVIFR